MNSNKIKQFIKNYGFYVAVALIAVGAIVAVFVFPKDGKIESQPNPYAKKEEASSRTVEKAKDTSKDFTIDVEEPMKDQNNSSVSVPATQPKVAGETQPSIVSGKETIVSKNFNSTTAKQDQTPYFAEGDTLNLPIKGKIIVPYTDDTTGHWFSKSLNQTMRTYGICVAAKKGDIVKSAAKGTVVDIIADSSTTNGYMPNVGVEIVLEHGNGIQTKYGLQGGKAYKDLLGKVVEAGDPIGEVGKPSGPFISEGNNIYFQVVKNGEVINPQDMLVK
ncbi:MAG: peptidoglycan DD-metalloendopeptidase family protein [Cellulosilyticaceae bacterium]